MGNQMFACSWGWEDVAIRELRSAPHQHVIAGTFFGLSFGSCQINFYAYFPGRIDLRSFHLHAMIAEPIFATIISHLRARIAQRYEASVASIEIGPQHQNVNT